MTKLMKTAALAGVLVAFLASTALELRAAEPNVREGQAVVTELAPNASATTYWVAESDGWHVVTTIDIVLGRSDIADHHAVARLFRGAFPGPSAGDLRSLCPRRATAGAAGPSHRRPDRNCPGPGLV